MNALALKGFVDRFRDILDTLDEFADNEDMEELNAQLEDAIFLLECADPEDKDEVDGALDEIASLIDEYRESAETDSDTENSLRSLEMLVRMAQNQ